MTVPHVAFVGYSDSGKTTLASRIVARLKQKGYKVGALKHGAHDDFQPDQEGKDTFKYMEAGADIVMIASENRVHLWEHSSEPDAYALNRLLQRFAGMDIVIIEGYKREGAPKILVARTEEQLALRHRLTGLLAIATTLPAQADVPVFRIGDIEGIACFVEGLLSPR